ncbi:BrnT family toxin [Methylobacterium sp. PvR107]|uniref:BrnT family toxin n=1 Tax=Methylobacterium sp. PvR107 TaxID=2806597 RepID=UPI001AE2ED58|nr:BrnT family toxin [Methylobacterium sp. PvR107]MBP1179094.1 uncharacterized DUF497 family protein [Methylobacterium sp. PvR107]
MPRAGFEWDERKRVLKLQTHGIDIRDAIGLFDHPHLSVESVRNDEVRKASLGKMDRCVIALVWTDRAGIIRMISARAARRNARQADTAPIAA